MQRKCDSRDFYSGRNSKTDQKLIHQHMCNHYRRILNAKKAIDDSPPYCFKLRRPLSSKPSVTGNKSSRNIESLPLSGRSLSTNSNKDSPWGGESHPCSSRYHANCVREYKYTNTDLINRITFDSKHGPGSHCYAATTREKTVQTDRRAKPNVEIPRKSSKEEPSIGEERSFPSTDSKESAQKRKFSDQKNPKPSGVSVKGSKSFSTLADRISSKIKAQAVSKLRSLRVYHPPRRKESRIKSDGSTNEQSTCTLEAPNCKFTKLCVCDEGETVLKKISFNPKEQSLTSSRDSAYNGGASSPTESRSPTPDQRRKKECACHCCENKQKEETSPRKEESPVKTKEQEPFKKLQEDALYVKFIQDITTEILNKNLYTNKALKKVMKKHVKNNLNSLQKERMLKEVENLRVQLGIPEDKTLHYLDAESEVSYPIISDSEFSTQKARAPEEARCPQKEARSISGVMTPGVEEEKMVSESDGDDLISVIQVTKTIREKRTEKSTEETPVVFLRWNSSDDSDRPCDPKKRSVPKVRKQKLLRSISSSSSSSECEGPLKFSRKFREKKECEEDPGSKESYTGDLTERSSFLNKKSRSVRFWKNSGAGLSPTFEMKHRTVARGKEIIHQDGRTTKAKND